MITVTHYKGKLVVVLGLGRSGIATVRALEAGGATVLAWDNSDNQRRQAEGVGLTLTPLDDVVWEDVAALVLSPGIPFTHPTPHPLVTCAQEHNVPVIGDIELFFHAVREMAPDVPIVAITGTNGKSTTTALIGHMVAHCGRKAEVGGNIGKPVLELAPPERNTVYVVELSSFQIDLAPGIKPSVAVLLNITPDHLDRHGSLAHYAAVKGRLFDNLDENDMAVIGVDDRPSMRICTTVCGRKTPQLVPVSVGKSLGQGVCVIDGGLYDNMGTQSVKAGDLRPLKTLAGAHNWQNAAMAFAAGRGLGFSRDDILSSFESFSGLVHRMELVTQNGRILYVNDSKATNADAASKALATYENIYWIAGGRAKAGGIATLDAFFPHVRRAYLIGEAAADFASTLGNHKVDVVMSGTIEAAVTQATRDAVSEGKDAVVLLSPACASFDQYANFELRGDAFRAAVHSLTTKEES